MKTTALSLIAALALGGSALADNDDTVRQSLQRQLDQFAQQHGAPQGMPDSGIFLPFVVGDQCVQLKTIKAAGAQFMPLKDGSFRLLEGFFVAIPPVSHELPPGDRAIIAVGPHGEMMALIVDGEQTCARFMIPPFMQEMVADVESRNKAPIAGSGL